MFRSPEHAPKHDVSKPILENSPTDELKPWSERSDTIRVILRRMSSNRKRPTILQSPPLDCASTSGEYDPSSPSASTSSIGERNQANRHSLIIRGKNTISRFVFETDFRCSGKCGVCSSSDLDTAFSPCRHIYACHDCAKVILRTTGLCPVCNHTIVDVDRC
ncbi:unnamed protein product [Strongylus vulgaris]|uniref:RING-type domain-containing protein n=1 Tax=Strongylus vulgaris TaxID=40348 RepID=A0A3P7J3K0_STRVU|nr:unnamed protein product [Strongylus vulgaris]